MQSAAAVVLMSSLIFLLCTETRDAFSTLKNCLFPWGIWTPMVPWAHPSHSPKRHIGRFSHFHQNVGPSLCKCFLAVLSISCFKRCLLNLLTNVKWTFIELTDAETYSIEWVSLSRPLFSPFWLEMVISDWYLFCIAAHSSHTDFAVWSTSCVQYLDAFQSFHPVSLHVVYSYL